MPVICDKIADSIAESINRAIDKKLQSTVNEHIKPLVDTINQQQKQIDEQKQMIAKQATLLANVHKSNEQNTRANDEQDKEIEALYRKVEELEYRLENQEQYSRRTSLRFHNIKIPVNPYTGKAIVPVQTDSHILKVCKDYLKLDLTKDDISRSHVIGKVKDGKTQVIVRFISYRTREKVYSSKRLLKDHPDKVFITENLTQFRANLVQTCLKYKLSKHIHTFWTADGRIFVKQTENSPKVLIQNYDDILEVVRRSHPENETDDDVEGINDDLIEEQDITENEVNEQTIITNGVAT